MVFSSLTFLLYFLPAVFLGYYLIPRRFRSARNFWLLGFSLLFYGCSGFRFLPLLVLICLVDYFCGFLAASQGSGRKKLGVALAAAVGVGLLGYYKYTGFFTSSLSGLGLPVKVLETVLPVGISFFTFQGLSYVMDVYRKPGLLEKNPLRVMLYVAFFPQLVAGPIVRYEVISHEIPGRRETLSEVTAGLTRFLFGLGKKLLLADAMGQIADAIFAYDAAALPMVLAWLGAISYTFQIYFDFSGYSDMAIGLGQLFGFHFPENFNYPYISRSIREFWTRWHISLSSWFRDYVYIPLGGSRKGQLRRVLNLLLVWLLTGLWHGAAWNFVLWGLWYFLFLMLERLIPKKKPLPGFLGWMGTMLVVMFGWVLFRAPHLGDALRFMGSMVGLGEGLPASAAVYYLKEYRIEWICAALAVLPWKHWLQNRLPEKLTAAASRLLALVLLGLSLLQLVTDSFNPFIYFQF